MIEIELKKAQNHLPSSFLYRNYLQMFQNNNGDTDDKDDVGASSDLPDETYIPDFLETKQANLARDGWELRGSCKDFAISEALNDPVNEILLIRIPGREDEFLYFNRLEGWEATDNFRDSSQEGEKSNFLELCRNELAREDWEYQGHIEVETILNLLQNSISEILLVRSLEHNNKFYYFFRTGIA